jgi:hypothetical protein
MDDQVFRRFFLDPHEPLQRRYEALRAIFVEGSPLEQVAEQFGYRPAALRSLVSRFRTGCRAGEPPPFLFATDEDGPSANACAQTNQVPSSQRSQTAES